MAFELDFSNVNESGTIPPGEYEVVIRNVEETTNKNGKTKIHLSTVIRNDVEQKYKNRYIYVDCWKSREPSEADMKVQGYIYNQIMTLAKAAGLQNSKRYETVLDLCKDFIGKPLRLKIKNEPYNGKIQEKVEYINESKFPECKHVFKEKQETQGAPTTQSTSTTIDVDFEDVPF